jgi:hypothetical protein
MPLYANLQAQAFYPPTLLIVLLSNLTGGKYLAYLLEWQVVLHVFMGGVFAYWLMRRLDASVMAALAGATVFQLGAFFATQTQHLGDMDGAAWLPLAWLAVVSLARGFSLRWLAALSAAQAMALLAGFPAMVFVVFVSAFLLAVVLAALRRGSWRLPAFVAMASVWALALGAVQLLPAVELTSLSIAKYRSEFMGTGGGIPIVALASMIIPNHFNVFDLAKFNQPWNITFMYIYSGVSGLALAILAFFEKRSRYKLPFAVMGAISMLWMLGDNTPIGRAVFLSLPRILRSSIYAEPAMAAFVLCMAVLAGLGAQRLCSRRPAWLGALVVVIAAADLILTSSGRPMNAGLLSGDSGFSEEHFEGSAETLSLMRKLTSGSAPASRIDTVDDSMNWAVAARYTGVPSSGGNDPLALLRFMQVRIIFTGGERWGRYYQVANADSKVLALLNTRYLVSRNPFASQSYRQVAELPGRAIYENPAALPRFFLVNTVHRVGNVEQALALMRSPDFDPVSAAAVEGGVDLQASDGSASVGSVRVAEYRSNRLDLDVHSPQRAFLVTSEVHYPGWRAFVDGVERPIVMTNGAFRGLPMPAGNHRVEMRFEPSILVWSALISIAALALMVTVLAGATMRRRHEWTS